MIQNNNVIDIDAFAFWTNARWAEFWGYVLALMQVVAPLLLLLFALWAVGMLIKMVVDAFKKADDDEEESSYRDDDDYKRKYRD